MNNYITFLLVFCSLCISNAQSETKFKNRLIGIDSKIEKLIEEHHAAGIAVAVIKDGNTIYTKGFGYRDYENKLPVDEHTVFGIGSCSKAFTAAVLGILESKDKLKLSDKPSKYIPELQFATEGLNDSLTIENLITHTTGLAVTPSESTAILFITPDKYELIPRLKYIKPTLGVEQGFIYNNLMYALAGLVSEKASGQDLYKSWKQNIFDPVEMKNTYADYPEASKNQNFSYGYAVDSIYPERVLAEVMSTRGAGGAIYSTVHDMSKWMQLWMNEGNYNGAQVLPKDYVLAAQDTLVLLPNNPNDSIPVPRFYGYGWGNWNHNGYKRSEHSGGTSGYVSNIVLYPEEKLGIVVLSNQTTTSLPSMVNNLIVERLIPELKERKLDIRYGQTFNIQSNDTPTIPNPEDAPNYDLSELIGTFNNPGFGDIVFSLNNKTLFVDFPLTKFRLEYIGNNTFIDHFSEQVPHTYWNFMDLEFIQNEAGEIESVLIDLDDPPVKFKRVE